MSRLIFIVLCAIGFLWWVKHRPVDASPGISAPNEPKQTETQKPSWEHKGFRFQPLARYEITARVMHLSMYFVGEESKLSPIDFALSWGPVSNPEVYKKMKVNQSGRWYYYEYPSDVAPEIVNKIHLHSANTHIIPANEDVKSIIMDIRENETVELKGYLVEVTGEKGWKWRSSTTRDDTAGGSCEVMWVEEAKVLSPY